MPTVNVKLFQVFPKKGDATNYRSELTEDSSAETLLAVDSEGNLVTQPKVTQSIAWDDITGKPGSFNPTSHAHDNRYYTETEIDTLLAAVDSLFGDYVETGVDYEIPTPVGKDGGLYTVKATATVDITVAGAGTIDGDATTRLYDGEALLLRSNGTEWMVT